MTHPSKPIARSLLPTRVPRLARVLVLAAFAWAVARCGGEDIIADPVPPPSAMALKGLLPLVAVPGTSLLLDALGFASTATYTLELSGQWTPENGLGRALTVTWPVTITTGGKGEVLLDDARFAALGPGDFKGQGLIIASSDGGLARGASCTVSLGLRRTLSPSIKTAGSALLYLNSRVPVFGDGFLLGGQEGTSRVEIKGCFLPSGQSGTCESHGKPVNQTLPLLPEIAGRRDRAIFEYSPSISGLTPGNLKATIIVTNIQAGSQAVSSSSFSFNAYLDRTLIQSLGSPRVSLGQILDLKGAGFVGGDQGSTAVDVDGTFTDGKGKSTKVTFTMVASYQSGQLVRYILEENQGLGAIVDLRKDTGTLSGTFTPTVYWGSQSQKGQPAQLTLTIAGVKQVVWLNFTKGWTESLRRFGLAAADPKIRQRMRQVLERDYKGINVEFREAEPTDFKLYVTLDLSGPDPNGLGLLGYDNTPGKDVNNKRLRDWIGGVNAVTQNDGFPGYGGIFLDSVLGFSQHPPAGVLKSSLRSDLFDQVFDPFRPDRGKELTAAEAAQALLLTSGTGCPASSGRVQQAACAIWVLSNTVGSTTSHELGHSLGLADPYGLSTQYHNPGDRANRLMEAGSTRPFEERAELNGSGPAVFCKDEFQYLQTILPLQPLPADPVAQRPDCY